MGLTSSLTSMTRERDLSWMSPAQHERYEQITAILLASWKLHGTPDLVSAMTQALQIHITLDKAAAR